MAAFTSSDMGESVFDLNALAELLTPSRRLLEATEPFLECLVFGDRNGSTAPRRSARAFSALGAGAADFRIELYGVAGLERLHLPLRASDRLRSQVDVEVRLREHPRTARPLSPGFREHLAASAEDVIDDRTVHLGPIDMKLGKRQALRFEVVANRFRPLFFGTIGWCHGAREDERKIEVAGNVLLISIEPLALALTPVAHLGVFDGDASFGCDAVANANSAILGLLQVLAANLRECLNIRSERCSHGLIEMTSDPSFERGHLALEVSIALTFCFGSLQSIPRAALILGASNRGMPARLHISSALRSVSFDTRRTMLRAA